MTSRFYTSIVNYNGSIVCKIKEDGFSTYDRKLTYPFEIYIKDPAGKELSLYNERLSKQIHDVSISAFHNMIYLKRQEYHSHKDADALYYGMDNGLIQYISREFPDDINFNSKDLNICFFDIETDVGETFPTVSEHKYPINTVTSIFTKPSGETETITYTTLKGVSGEGIVYKETEYELLKSFAQDLKDFDVDAITGWNSKFFDIPYIIKRMEKLQEGFSNQISPIYGLWGEEKLVRERTDREMNEVFYDILGIVHLDYMELYKKYTREKKENYKLETISQEELGEGKHDYSEYGGSMKAFFDANKQAYVDYNIQDTLLLYRMNEKLRYMELAFVVSFFTKCRVEDVFTVTNVWDAFIYNYLKKDIIVIPPRIPKEKVKYEGAFVKEPIIGKHKWMVSFDLTSMYPMIIQQLGISPETLMRGASPEKERIKEEFIQMIENPEVNLARQNNWAMGANGTMYRKDILGVIPAVIGFVFDKRVVYKGNMKQWQKEKERVILELERREINYEE